MKINIGKEYLEKIIQYPIKIPRLNAKEVEFYITCLLLQKDLTKDEFDETISFFNSKKRRISLTSQLIIACYLITFLELPIR